MCICIYIYIDRDDLGLYRDDGEEDGSYYLGLRLEEVAAETANSLSRTAHVSFDAPLG